MSKHNNNGDKLTKMKSYLSIIAPIIIVIAGYLIFRTTAQGHMNNETIHLSEVQVIQVSKINEVYEMLTQIRDIVMSNERGLGLVENEMKHFKETQDKILTKLEGN